ncbi:DUF5134 domain-containing protein [Nocardia sp. XZ_19_385]|uniref:DUF5134 domain-containing protein n=1 Tax=Nocardia sp. XZ_19_385 TaxID=2769488 RepID=UPI00188F5109|nr:DUF5134 domain-containing protein [Nocardia sp. XZ_19_385]
MAHFVQEYAALRWSVVGAFLVASVIVVGRLAAPARWAAGRCGGWSAAGEGLGGREFGGGRVVVQGGQRRWNTAAREVIGDPCGRPAGADSARRQEDSVPSTVSEQDRAVLAAGAAHYESDAAHLLMCLVMLAMLVFPASANPEALRGVLIAMTVVFAALLVSRITQWRKGSREQVVALGYHLLAAAAMWYAMSGHSAAGHAGPMPVVAFGLAALFLMDAFAVAATGGRHLLGHASGPVLTSALVPHVVMDLGTAYMLVGAVLA